MSSVPESQREHKHSQHVYCKKGFVDHSHCGHKIHRCGQVRVQPHVSVHTHCLWPTSHSFMIIGKMVYYNNLGTFLVICDIISFFFPFLVIYIIVRALCITKDQDGGFRPYGWPKDRIFKLYLMELL